MTKFRILVLLFLFKTTFLFAESYPFEGKVYINSPDYYFSFTEGYFEEYHCTQDGVWKKNKNPYITKMEGCYLISLIQKCKSVEKLYIFNCDEKHIIFFNSTTKEVIDGTERKGHRDEPWIYSAFNYETSSFLTEEINGEKISYLVENLKIDKLSKSWVEGVEGFGKGEKISFENCGNGSRRVYVINGFFYPNNTKLFYDNNRVKEFKINCYKNDLLIETVYRKIEDTGLLQVIEFDNRYDKLDFIIEDIYPGKRFDDTAITGIFLDALDCFEN